MSAINFKTFRWPLVAIFASGCAFAASSAKQCSIAGTWELVSYESAGGASTLPLGKDPVGLIVYDRGGNVTAQLMRRDRELADAIAPAQPGGTTVTGGYVAYFGKYSVNCAESSVTHTVEAALSKSDIGRTLTRHFRFEGAILVLEVGEGRDARILKWRRIAE
jgi:hypothetical protein